MFIKTFKASIFNRTFGVIWLKLNDKDALLVLDNDAVEEGPVRHASGTKWLWKDFDYEIRTAVAKIFSAEQDEDFMDTFNEVEYEEMLSYEM